MVVYITGDKHGDYSGVFNWCASKSELSKEKDHLIVLGDHGINYFGLDHRTNHKVSKLPLTLFCISGNHD